MTFLRPWFLLLVLVPFLFSVFNREKHQTSSWKKIISPELLPYLLVKGTTAKTKRRQLSSERNKGTQNFILSLPDIMKSATSVFMDLAKLKA